MLIPHHKHPQTVFSPFTHPLAKVVDIVYSGNLSDSMILALKVFVWGFEEMVPHTAGELNPKALFVCLFIERLTVELEYRQRDAA